MTRCRIVFAPAVLLLAAAMALGPRPADQPVTLDQVPAAARKTIEARLGGGEITEIERSRKDGKVVYEVEVKRKDGVFDLLIGEDGTFLGQEGPEAADEEGAEDPDEGEDVEDEDEDEGDEEADDEGEDEGEGDNDDEGEEGKDKDNGARALSKRPDTTIAVPTPLMDGVRFSPVITNPYFPLTTVRVAEFRGRTMRMVCEVQEATKIVGGVECLVMAEKEFNKGALLEISYNYFAQDPDGNVYYFGEDVDEYKDGKVVGHGGAWLVGGNAAEPCLFMPASPVKGLNFKRENSPPDAEEWDRIDRVGATLRVPAGRFRDVLVVQESDRTDRWEEVKYYARGVGLISENRTLNLVALPKGAEGAAVERDDNGDDEGDEEDDDEEEEEDEGGADKPPQRPRR